MYKAEIVIIGGGITGSAIAYFLAQDGRGGRILVVEPDPTYGRATTSQGAGGVRQLFSRPENIEMSKYSLSFYHSFDETMAIDGEGPAIQFENKGYLFIATSTKGGEIMRRNYDLQVGAGVKVQLLDHAMLHSKFPSIESDDMTEACYSEADGWIEPTAALWGFRKKAISLGVEYLKDRVVAMDVKGPAVCRIHLGSRKVLEADVVVDAAGPWAGELAAMADIDIPVVSMCRACHFWHCAVETEELPLIKDDHGLFFRPEGDGFVGGVPAYEVKPGFNWDPDRGYFSNYFQTTVWPLLVRRMSKFKTIRLGRTWCGHYSENIFDANMIIGQISKTLKNIFTASGFSGHGIMHAPAIGRGLAELILDGTYQSIDLTRLGIQRVWDNVPYPELGIK